MVHVVDKGKRAERQVRSLLQSVVTRVYTDYGIDVPILERNLQQSIKGGADIRGLDWLAVEVKHQETVKLEQWWRQTCEQAGTDLLGRPIGPPPTEGIRSDGFIDGRAKRWTEETQQSAWVGRGLNRVPILFWKTNGNSWNIVMPGLVKAEENHVRMRISIGWEAFRTWFELRLRQEIKKIVDGENSTKI